MGSFFSSILAFIVVLIFLGLIITVLTGLSFLFAWLSVTIGCWVHGKLPKLKENYGKYFMKVAVVSFFLIRVVLGLFATAGIFNFWLQDQYTFFGTALVVLGATWWVLVLFSSIMAFIGSVLSGKEVTPWETRSSTTQTV